MDFLITTLAGFRLAYLIQEPGPFGVISKVKGWLEQLHPEVAKALSCFNCLTGYTTIIAIFLPKPIKYWLGIWGACWTINRFLHPPNTATFEPSNQPVEKRPVGTQGSFPNINPKAGDKILLLQTGEVKTVSAVTRCKTCTGELDFHTETGGRVEKYKRGQFYCANETVRLMVKKETDDGMVISPNTPIQLTSIEPLGGRAFGKYPIHLSFKEFTKLG